MRSEGRGAPPPAGAMATVCDGARVAQYERRWFPARTRGGCEETPCGRRAGAGARVGLVAVGDCGRSWEIARGGGLVAVGDCGRSREIARGGGLVAVGDCARLREIARGGGLVAVGDCARLREIARGGGLVACRGVARAPALSWVRPLRHLEPGRQRGVPVHSSRCERTLFTPRPRPAARRTSARWRCRSARRARRSRPAGACEQRQTSR